MRVLRLRCRRPTAPMASWRGIRGVAMYRPHMYETPADLAHLQRLLDDSYNRGAFYFGSSPESVRLRHIGQRPQVSATHLPGEDLAVTVHGRAVPIDVRNKSEAGFRRALLDVYVPRYGPKWEEFLNSGPVYARIDADRMFTLSMDATR